MKNLQVKQGDTHNNAFDVELAKLATIIASDIDTANSITILRLPTFTLLDIKSYLHSVITQLA